MFIYIYTRVHVFKEHMCEYIYIYLFIYFFLVRGGGGGVGVRPSHILTKCPNTLTRCFLPRVQAAAVPATCSSGLTLQNTVHLSCLQIEALYIPKPCLGV